MKPQRSQKRRKRKEKVRVTKILLIKKSLVMRVQKRPNRKRKKVNVAVRGTATLNGRVRKALGPVAWNHHVKGNH